MAFDVKKITSTASKIANDAMEQAPGIAKNITDSTGDMVKK